MINLIKAELFRMYKLKSLRFVTAITWLFPISMLVIGLGVSGDVDEWILISNKIMIYIVFLSLVAAAMPGYVIFVSLFSNGDEYINNVISRSIESSYSRKEIFIAKYITQYIYSFFIILVTGLIFIVISLFIKTKGEFMDYKDLILCIKVTFYVFLGTSASLAFLNLIYVILKKDIYVLGSYFVYFFMNNIVNIIGSKFGMSMEKITNYFPGAIYKELLSLSAISMSYVDGEFLSMHSYVPLEKYVIYLLGYMIIFVIINFLIFRKKDFV